MANLPSLLTCGWAFASVTPPVGGPARVADSGVAGQAALQGLGDEVVDAAGLLDHLERVVMLDRKARGIIAAVLESLQTFEQNCRCLLFADVADDSTHKN